MKMDQEMIANSMRTLAVVLALVLAPAASYGWREDIM